MSQANVECCERMSNVASDCCMSNVVLWRLASSSNEYPSDYSTLITIFHSYFTTDKVGTIRFQFGQNIAWFLAFVSTRVIITLL